MGYTHHYGLIKEGDENKEEPTIITPPPTTSWWKIVLSHLLAAAIGAGLLFLVARGTLVEIQQHALAIANATTPSNSTSVALPVSPILYPPSAAQIEEEHAHRLDDGTNATILDCGHTPEMARAKGCVFDVMMQDWVPEPCYDSVLTERYLAQGNYTWYADGDGKTVMSDEQMRKGEHGVAWMSNGYHNAHCVFSWVKIIRALRNKRGISQELLSYDHVMHCAHGALRSDPTDQVLGVSAPTNYAKCAIYETWALKFIPDHHNSTEK